MLRSTCFRAIVARPVFPVVRLPIHNSLRLRVLSLSVAASSIQSTECVVGVIANPICLARPAAPFAISLKDCPLRRSLVLLFRLADSLKILCQLMRDRRRGRWIICGKTTAANRQRPLRLHRRRSFRALPVATSSAWAASGRAIQEKFPRPRERSVPWCARGRR